MKIRTILFSSFILILMVTFNIHRLAYSMN